MIAKLEFNLPEENYEFKLASSAGALISFVEDMTNWVRYERKYGQKSLLSYDDLWTKIHELLQEADVPAEVLRG